MYYASSINLYQLNSYIFCSILVRHVAIAKWSKHHQFCCHLVLFIVTLINRGTVNKLDVGGICFILAAACVCAGTVWPGEEKVCSLKTMDEAVGWLFTTLFICNLELLSNWPPFVRSCLYVWHSLLNLILIDFRQHFASVIFDFLIYCRFERIRRIQLELDEIHVIIWLVILPPNFFWTLSFIGFVFFVVMPHMLKNVVL